MADKAVGPLIKVVVWLWHRYRPDTSVVALRAAVQELAWRIEIGEVGHLTGLGVALASDAVDVGFRALPNVRAAGGPVSGTISGIGDYYRGLSPRRLVVVGEPGAGKTVAVSLLVLDLLKQRRQHPDQSLPVRLNASSWNPDTASFTAWLTGRLVADYGVSRPVAAKLTQSDWLLPVVDGFDELDIPDRVRRGLDQLNITGWRGRPLVLACRTGTYERARAAANDAGLHFATAVTLRPLAAPAVGAYLNSRRRNTGTPAQIWEPVTRLLRNPVGALAKALNTPWMLTLAAGHIGRGDEQVAASLAAMDDPDAIREYLITEIVPAAVAEQPLTEHAGRRYQQPQVHTWLHHLAQYLNDLGTVGKDSTTIGLDRIGDMARARSRMLFAITVAVVTGLAGAAIGALTVGIAYAVEFNYTLAVGRAEAYAILFGGSAAIINGLRARYTTSVRAKQSIWHAHGHGTAHRWRHSLLIAGGATIAVVVPLALSFQVLVWLTRPTGIDPHVHWWAPPLVLAAYGIAVAAAYGSSRHGLAPLDERRILADDARSGIIAGMLLGTAAGLVTTSNTLPYATDMPVDWPVIRGAATAIPFGLVAGLTWSHASVRYLCAQTLFASETVFCRHPAAFLDWAHRAGLLRATAGSYQFRHDTLQRWLATHPYNPEALRANPGQ